MTPEEIRSDLEVALVAYDKKAQGNGHGDYTQIITRHQMRMNAEDVAQLAELNQNIKNLMETFGNKSEFEKIFGKRWR